MLPTPSTQNLSLDLLKIILEHASVDYLREDREDPSIARQNLGFLKSVSPFFWSCTTLPPTAFRVKSYRDVLGRISQRSARRYLNLYLLELTGVPEETAAYNRNLAVEAVEAMDGLKELTISWIAEAPTLDTFADLGGWWSSLRVGDKSKGILKLRLHNHYDFSSSEMDERLDMCFPWQDEGWPEVVAAFGPLRMMEITGPDLIFDLPLEFDVSSETEGEDIQEMLRSSHPKGSKTWHTDGSF
ncbi:hypothetical protein BV25DRAFT_1915299 [Artomyces pyxidatus]|uniref:Uncharacterized protein n=1 Tax=Artomyces pyxidatus TaxID=48021 RepID=A0ACB8T642_9AGAM|nr:hypothetical protein BV25DRAFT_1915299 [Artomyces pyxidatus]